MVESWHGYQEIHGGTISLATTIPLLSTTIVIIGDHPLSRISLMKSRPANHTAHQLST